MGGIQLIEVQMPKVDEKDFEDREARFRAAQQDFQNGVYTTCAAAARAHRVARVTLSNRIKGKHSDARTGQAARQKISGPAWTKETLLARAQEVAGLDIKITMRSSTRSVHRGSTALLNTSITWTRKDCRLAEGDLQAVENTYLAFSKKRNTNSSTTTFVHQHGDVGFKTYLAVLQPTVVGPRMIYAKLGFSRCSWKRQLGGGSLTHQLFSFLMDTAPTFPHESSISPIRTACSLSVSHQRPPTSFNPSTLVYSI